MRHILPILLFVAGCTTGPGITPVPSAPDVFVLVREATVSVQQADTLAKETLAEATNFCEARAAAIEVIDQQASTKWNASGNVPVFKMRFRCVPRAASPTQASGTTPK